MSASPLRAPATRTYTDVVIPVAYLIWSDIPFRGCDPETALEHQGPRVFAKLQHLDAICPRVGSEDFIVGDQATLADYFAADAFESALYIAQDPPALRTRLPRLDSLTQRLEERALARGKRPKRPERLTGRPGEPAIVERLRAIPFGG